MLWPLSWASQIDGPSLQTPAGTSIVVDRGRKVIYRRNVDVDLIKKLVAAMNDARVRYKIFGGAALNLHGLSRFTEDLDIFIEPTHDNVERLKTALRTVFADSNIDEITANDLLGDYPSVQYVPPDEGAFHIDIVTRLGEAFRYEDLEASEIDFAGVPVIVVTPQQLYRMKRDTIRTKDRADAEALQRRFNLDDEP